MLPIKKEWDTIKADLSVYDYSGVEVKEDHRRAKSYKAKVLEELGLTDEKHKEVHPFIRSSTTTRCARLGKRCLVRQEPFGWKILRVLRCGMYSMTPSRQVHPFGCRRRISEVRQLSGSMRSFRRKSQEVRLSEGRALGGRLHFLRRICQRIKEQEKDGSSLTGSTRQGDLAKGDSARSGRRTSTTSLSGQEE